MVGKKVDRWIQEAVNPKKEGSLHRQLGIPKSKVIPKKLLRDIVDTDIGKQSHGHTVTPLLKKRSNFALNAQKHK